MSVYCRLAADIVPGRLESAKLVGADVTIHCKEENLKDRGTIGSETVLIDLFFCCHCVIKPLQ